MQRPHRSTLIALGLWLVASAAAAQNLNGRVLNDATDRPLEGVRVTLMDEEGSPYAETFTDQEGWFSLPVPRPGSWVVRAELIGFAQVASDPVAATPDERVILEVRMAVEAVPVDPVVVTGRINTLNAQIRGFYDRVERGRRSGLGRFVTRADVVARSPSEPSDLLRGMPGVRITRRARSVGSGSAIRMSSDCVPAIYVDGSRINRFNGIADNLDDFVTASSIEGIEVYRGTGVQVGRFHDDGGCGLILVWTQRGSNEGPPFTWSRFAVGAGILALLFLLF